MAAKMSAASAVRSSCSAMPGRIGIVFMRTKIAQAEGKSKRSLRLCRGAAYLSGSSSSAKCASRGQKQTKFAVLPRRSIYGTAKVRFFFVSPRPAEDASAACGGTMQPSAWGGCGLPLSGRSRRANLLQSLVLAESECESVGNILNVYPEASRTFDSASPARSSFYHLLLPKGGCGALHATMIISSLEFHSSFS